MQRTCHQIDRAQEDQKDETKESRKEVHNQHKLHRTDIRIDLEIFL
jgi:hypothetical protein